VKENYEALLSLQGLGSGIKLEFCGVQTPNDKPYIESFTVKQCCFAALAATSGRKFTGISMRISLKRVMDGKITWNGTITTGRTAR